MAAEIQLRLYEELSDSLPLDKKKIRFAYQLGNIRAVEELQSSLAVPRKDVDLVRVNGASVELDVLSCPRCGARMRVLCPVNPPEAIQKILAYLGLPMRAPPISPAVPDGDAEFFQ